MTRAAANKRLSKAFDKFNKLYFAGALQKPTLLRYTKLRKGIAGEQCFLTDSIELDDSLIPLERTSGITLLHEMCHLSNGRDYLPEHGGRFDAEIHRIYMMGAYEGLL